MWQANLTTERAGSLHPGKSTCVPFRNLRQPTPGLPVREIATHPLPFGQRMVTLNVSTAEVSDLPAEVGLCRTPNCIWPALHPLTEAKHAPGRAPQSFGGPSC